MLAKQVQTELAQANSVADEVLATMTTVRAHAADDSAKAAYGVKLAKFYILQVCMPLPTHTARRHLLACALHCWPSPLQKGKTDIANECMTLWTMP